MSNNVISIYTRRQALSDGCILDVSELAREAGFTWAVAITDHLYHDYIVPALALVAEGQSVQGRLWDTLMCLRHAIRSSKDDTYLRFTVLFQMSLGAAPMPVELVSVAGPDDGGYPCLTIMLPEDY
ncbi:MAG: DUF6573 family protein [bacterium]|jgi:hypothetical protein